MLRIFAAVLVALGLVSSTTGCVQYCGGLDQKECQRFQSGHVLMDAVIVIISNLFRAEPAPIDKCPGLIRCVAPYCRAVEENGSFEVVTEEGSKAIGWHGYTFSVPALGCIGDRLRGIAPSLPDAASRAYLFQVIRYADLVPPEARRNVRRIRAQAYFEDEPESAGLRLFFFAGDPDAFPTEGDPEVIPDVGPGFSSLGFAEASEPTRDGGVRYWFGTNLSAEIPESTQFIVVQVMGRGTIDYVLVTLDTGNTRLFANDDFGTTDVNMPVEVQVLNNDYDVDSRIDPATLTLVSPPSHGLAEVHLGTVTAIGYTPDVDFVGYDSFRYIVADEEGLFSGEATVTVEVRPKGITPVPAVVFEDGFDTNPSGRWQAIASGSGFGFLDDRHLEVWRSEDGNPAGFRWMKHTTIGEGVIRVAHLYRPHFYLPKEQGAVDSLVYSEDRRSFKGFVAARVVVMQGGALHYATLPLVSPSSTPPWTTEARTLTAADFSPVPDFSASGDTMWFGYERANSNTNPSGTQETEHGIDNWIVTVQTRQPG